MMASATMGTIEEVNALIERRGFVRAMEPACGAGAMVIALADVMRAEGINYQQHLHVTAVDIDARVAHMAYIQFSLLHIPAVVIVGNSLSLQMRDHWYTPAHIMGGWSARLARHETEGRRTMPPLDDTSIAPKFPPLSAPGFADSQTLPQQLSLF